MIRHAILTFGFALASTVTANAGLTISTSPTSNVSCTLDTCTATAGTAVLNVSTLETMLSKVRVKVIAPVPTSVITISAPLSWAFITTLTLDAAYRVQINQPVVYQGPGGGGLLITTHADLGNSSWAFGAHGSITFLDTHAQLSINGDQYTLANSLSGLAAAVAKSPTNNFALAADYNAGPDGIYSASPIPTTLDGKFEGLRHTISNLKVSDPVPGHNVGLFSFAFNIRDLNLIAANIAGGDATDTQPEYVGGIVGLGSTLYCVMRGKVSAGDGTGAGAYVGGIVGDGGASDSRFSGSVSGGSNLLIGGILGRGGVVHSTASVVLKAHSAAHAGGVVGYTTAGVDTSSSSGNIVVGDGSFVGGVVGGEEAVITNSFSTANVQGGSQSYVGGFAGFAFDVISGSFATGAVKGKTNSEVGGFTGQNSTETENDYALGSVKGGHGSSVGGFTGVGFGESSNYSTGKVSGGSVTGGFVGNSYVPGTAAYWNTTTSGTDKGAGNGESGGFVGLNDGQLKSGLPAGFDSAIWGESASINDGYPYLLANPPPQ